MKAECFVFDISYLKRLARDLTTNIPDPFFDKFFEGILATLLYERFYLNIVERPALTMELYRALNELENNQFVNCFNRTFSILSDRERTDFNERYSKLLFTRKAVRIVFI